MQIMLIDLIIMQVRLTDIRFLFPYLLRSCFADTNNFRWNALYSAWSLRRTAVWRV